MVTFTLVTFAFWCYLLHRVHCIDAHTVPRTGKSPADTLTAAVNSDSTVSSEGELHSSASKQLDACLLKYSAKITVEAVDDNGKSSSVGVFKREGKKEEEKRALLVRRINAAKSLDNRAGNRSAPPVPSLRQVGFTPLKVNKFKSAWTIEVETFDQQKLNLIFDSGSALTIVNPGSYTPSYLSQTTGNKVGVQYMDGTVGGGRVVNEVWKIAGLTIPSNVVMSDTPVIAMDIADGVMGVGFTDTALAASLIEAMVSNYTLLYDSISITLTDRGDGALALGVLDASIVNDVEYTDVLTKTLHAWDVEASVNGGANFPAIIDTGTTYAFIPLAAAVQLFDSLGLKTASDSVAATRTLWGLVEDCNKVPEIFFTIKDIKTKYRLNPNTVLAWTGGDTCRLAIIGAEIKQAVIGSTFLRNVHLVFDRNQYKIGFAQRVPGKGEFQPHRKTS